MATNFSWRCPYCDQNATITDSNRSIKTHAFNLGNKDGELRLQTVVTVCPNGKCNEYTIGAELFEYSPVPSVKGGMFEPPLLWWSLKPRSSAKQFTKYVPIAIQNDYEEACLIRDLSPKASATLSRRCLQGMIRDFWGIKKDRLKDEIDALEEKVNPLDWKAIDAVRSIGNIGAHMEKDINLIIDVEPKEAQLLIGLIEMLIKDWYIVKNERERHLRAIIDTADSKKKKKLELKTKL